MANPLLIHYIKLTEFLGQVLGPDYEVVLHDLTDKNQSIIAIANNHVSGREIGAPLTNVALKFLMDKCYETQNYRLHYTGVSASGKALRSSTLFIKDDGKLIGMLCINFDDSRYRDVGDAILKLCHPDSFMGFEPVNETLQEPEFHSSLLVEESFHNSIDAVVSEAVGRELDELGVTADRLTADERMHIITALEAGGIFLLKGAIPNVAEALHCSQASVYRYLSQVKNSDQGND
ncbi:MAG: PAS domain-containing protein [Lachnospiraceae bacterium]|nr:PAS domain-containing protein [Lachnospiraceae bacterium]